MIWCNPEDLGSHQYQFGGLDELATYLDSFELLGLRALGVVLVGLMKVCIFHNQKMHFYLIQNTNEWMNKLMNGKLMYENVTKTDGHK